MNEDLEKTPVLNNPETYVLTHNRLNTYLVLIFSDLKKAQIYKMPYRDSLHHEIQIVRKFDYQQLFKPIDLDDKETIKDFLFKIEDKNYTYVGDKIFTFKTHDEITKYYSEEGFNYIKYSNALGNEKIYYMSHQKYIPINEYENSMIKDPYQYLYKKDDELKGIKEAVVYGNDFLN